MYNSLDLFLKSQINKYESQILIQINKCLSKQIMITRRQNSRFSIMVAGPKGSGKSSFFNSIIGKEIVKNENSNEINIYMLNLECNGINQKISLIDTPGFGESFNDNSLQESIITYIKEQYDLFIMEENKIRRNSKYEDTRVHCLLYFIPSTSGGLKHNDIAFLRKISHLTNIIPVISKADGLTSIETERMKK
ncbi:MAG: 50S ribosome-binding GTPase, partial [Romboutsia sp.]|nr:50S ribosome-binding GTPase [Romboutsia sp.]